LVTEVTLKNLNKCIGDVTKYTDFYTVIKVLCVKAAAFRSPNGIR